MLSNKIPNIDSTYLSVLLWKKYKNEAKVQDIPDDIKLVIAEFTKRIFDSKILSMQQDLNLVQLLSTKLSTINKQPISLLFRASEYGFSAEKFHDICDGHSHTITLIASNFGNTNIPWSRDGDFHSDQKDTFLFLLHSTSSIDSQQVWNYQDSAEYGEVLHQKKNGPCFGGGCDIRIQDEANLFDGKSKFGLNY